MMAFTEWLPASIIKTIDSRYSAVGYNTMLSHLAGTIQLMEPHGDDALLFGGTQYKTMLRRLVTK